MKKEFKNFIMILIDDLRYDCISFNQDKRFLKKYYLDKYLNTPNLDEFASKGAFFTKAYSVGAYTPSTTSTIFSGLYPFNHQVRAFLKNPLPDNVKLLAEIFKENGFATLASIDFYDIYKLCSLTKGFDVVYSMDDRNFFNEINKNKEENKFVFFHFGDVHPPYGETFYKYNENDNEDFYEHIVELAGIFNITDYNKDEIKEDRNKLIELDNNIRTTAEKKNLADIYFLSRYVYGVNKFDRIRFKHCMENLKKTGLLENSLIIILSDHGQGVIKGDELAQKQPGNKFDHGEVLKQDIIRVPLIFYHKGIKNQIIHNAVSSVNIFQTVLDYFNIKETAKTDGASMKKLIETVRPDKDNPAIYSEVFYHNRSEFSRFLRECKKNQKILSKEYFTFLYQQALIEDDYKLLRVFDFKGDCKDLFFNIKNDYNEEINLLELEKILGILKINSKEIKEKYKKMKYQLEALLSSNKNNIITDTIKIENEDIERKLKDLGYL